MAALKGRDKTAFEYLYDNYSAALNGIIFRIVNDEDTSNDILQDVFVKIWQNFSSYDATKGRLFTWMANIARNASIDYTRSGNFKISNKIQNVDDSVSKINTLMSTSSRVDHIGIDEVVNRLKPEFRQLIDLAYFAGMTHEEISKHLNLPLGTVKTRIRSALMQLRQTLNVKLN